MNQYPFELSGGLRQRVIIAMGLVCSPKLLIADEPTTALDVTIQAQILDILDNLRKELKMAVLLITHDMGVIAGRADRVVVMYAGKKAEESSTSRALPLDATSLHPSALGFDAQLRERFQAQTGLHRRDATGPYARDRALSFRAAMCYATDQCRTEEPPLTLEGEHAYACFHPTTALCRCGRRARRPRRSAAAQDGTLARRRIWSRSSRSRAESFDTRSVPFTRSPT